MMKEKGEEGREKRKERNRRLSEKERGVKGRRELWL